jgi:HEAT repeat protein
VWADSATAAVVEALGDEHWRVREMAAKVVAKHRMDEALERVVELRTDTNQRVSDAATRAVRMLT